MIYTGAFVKIYNWQNRRLVHETHEMVEFENYPISRTENCLNLRGQRFYKISQVLQNYYIMPRNIEGNTFYFNNYIDQDQFN